jgi:hypothetical protein
VQNLLLKALLLIAAGALSSIATAQKTYKCGDTYSQTACPGGVLIDTADPRSNAQKVQSDLLISRDAKTADAMQKSRLQQEAKDLAANSSSTLPTAPAPAPAVQDTPQTSQLKKKKKAPEYFTAQVPGEKKKKKAPKKTVAKKDASKP